MVLSPTTVIHGAPKAVAITAKATVATIHDLLVSTDCSGLVDEKDVIDCSMSFALLARPAGFLSL
jgi:hypothetical protein